MPQPPAAPSVIQSELTDAPEQCVYQSGTPPPAPECAWGWVPGPCGGFSSSHSEEEAPLLKDSGTGSVETRTAGGHGGPLTEAGCLRGGQHRTKQRRDVEGQRLYCGGWFVSKPGCVGPGPQGCRAHVLVPHVPCPPTPPPAHSHSRSADGPPAAVGGRSHSSVLRPPREREEPDGNAGRRE